jgi:hypothetical protein
MFLIQTLLSLSLFASLWLVWRRKRQGAVGLRVASLWSLGTIGALVVVWIPETASRAAQLFGVGRGADLVVYLGLVLLFVLVFLLHVSHVRLERQLTDLVRKEALQDLPLPLLGQEERENV